ncbi:MAG TPA: DUF4382 domain-containing protein, partial [Candidatus Eisenbacteria bacterium]|nr:DUF4382 domain-containing protein [Candidatus Eisenbacteria bacterium]
MKTRALALTLLVLSAACPARASFSGGEAVRCVVTVKKVLLKNRAGDWLTLSDAEYPIDLAGEQASFTVENKGRLPAGDYENFRIVLSETFKVAGVDGAARLEIEV